MSFALRIKRALARDAELPLEDKLYKAAANVRAFALAPLYLRDCDRVGLRARSRGRPIIDNRGTLTIGRDFHVNNAFSAVEMRVASGASLQIADDVFINYGTQLSALESIIIGSRVTIGPHSSIADAHIGDDVWLAARVRVSKGVRVGDRTVVAAGSVVTASLPPDVIAGGVPARVIKPREVSTAVRSDPSSTSPAQSSWLEALSGMMLRLSTRARLSAWSSLGDDANITGSPVIENRGRIDIGSRFSFSSHPRISHIVTARSGRVIIGNDVSIGCGAAITSEAEISIGNGVHIGRNVMVLDTDFHEVSNMHSRGVAQPIVIERGVRIEDDVIVLKGSRIGEGARIGEGSVVSGVIPAGAFATGVLARIR